MTNLKHKTLLITGGTGLIGSHLIEALLPQKANIITISRSFNPRSYFAAHSFHQQVVHIAMDVRDGQHLLELVIKYAPEYIIHLAAQPLVDVALDHPVETLATNIMGTTNILEAARKSPAVKGIIIASSDKAYGKLSKKNYIETDPLKGDHPYEVSKSATDLIGQMYHRTYGLPVIVTRFGNIYGPGDLNFNRIIPKLCRAIILKRKLSLRSDGTFVRDYLYIKDVVNGYLRILQNIDKHTGECFNFGSHHSLSVIDVIKAMEKVISRKITFKTLNTQKNEIPRQSLLYTKAHKLLGWSPHHDLSASLKTTLDWYRQYFSL
jgi:CDP-glucose 4,6-dehydratase